MEVHEHISYNSFDIIINYKELDRMNGLNWYDHGARMLDAALHVWDRVDPLAEKYYNVSPYAYCAGNSVMVDLD